MSCIGVFVSVESIGLPTVDGIGKRPGSSAFMHGLEGFKEMGRGEGYLWDIGVISLRLGVSEVTVWNVRRESLYMYGLRVSE
jgi:hypothetical protein